MMHYVHFTLDRSTVLFNNNDNYNHSYGERIIKYEMSNTNIITKLFYLMINSQMKLVLNQGYYRIIH